MRAESGREALDALRELTLRGEPVAAILADYRMPEMNGIEFLEAAMDIAPHARRALLTAYADTDAAISAINVVDVDHYLLKPWDPPEEKLYPVVDALVDDVARGSTPVRRGPCRRAPLVAAVRSARATSSPATSCPSAGSPSTSPRRPSAGGGRGRPDDVPLVVPTDGTTQRNPSEVEIAAAVGSPPTRCARSTTWSSSAADRRAWPRRCTGRRRGCAPSWSSGRPRAARRAQLAHRELPRLPRRCVRRRAHHRARPQAASSAPRCSPPAT